MNVRRTYAICLRQLFLLRDSPQRFGSILVQPILDVVLWGFITRYLDTIAHSGFSFVPILLGAIVLWDFLVRVQQGVMLAFLEDVWSRNFLNYFASPLTITEYVAGLVAISILTSTTGFLLMTILAGIVFGYRIFTLGVLLIPFLAILFTFGLSVGIFIAGFVFRFGPAAEWLAWPIAFFLSPFVGVFYPISVLPAPLQIVAKLIPASYVFEGMRSVLSAGQASPSVLLVGITLACLYLISAYLFFVHIYRLVLKSGLITRFSAEQV
jgi:ABC-2 type transport system permease protein